jgi:hypothetical protein
MLFYFLHYWESQNALTSKKRHSTKLLIKKNGTGIILGEYVKCNDVEKEWCPPQCNARFTVEALCEIYGFI